MSQPSPFERLALPHLGAAFNLAFWLVRSRNDAEDIVQEAYLRALRAFDGFTGTEFRPWLLTIVRHAAYRWLNQRRRASNVVSLEEAFAGTGDQGSGECPIAADQPSAEQQLIGRAERDGVRAALAQLPPAFREVLVLREIEELSYREIADVTGLPVGTVMSRLARGRTKLRQILSDFGEKETPDAV